MIAGPRGALSPHARDRAEVVALLGGDGEAGLSQDEARRRLLRVAENRVGDHRDRPLWRLALDQFKSLVVLLLLAASVIAWLLEERVEAVAILAALLLNAAIGFGSEWRARVSLARLRALGVPQALCRRGGALRRLAAAELVPGDLIVLEAGAQVPADARLLRSAALRVAEAALTGESVPVDKDAEARLPADTPLADRITMVYWINLVTDTFPAAALIRDPAEPDIMRRPPRDPQEALVTWRFGRRMAAEGALLAAGVLSGYLWVVWREGAGAHANTIAFVALVLLHPFQAMNCRSDRVGWWRLPANWLTWGSLLALGGLQWLTVSWGPLQALLGTVPLSGGDWLAVVCAVLWPVLLMEVGKSWWPVRSRLGSPRPTSEAVTRDSGTEMP